MEALTKWKSSLDSNSELDELLRRYAKLLESSSSKESNKSKKDTRKRTLMEPGAKRKIFAQRKQVCIP
eukprot:312249-Karenia_brevis.AAC.1